LRRISFMLTDACQLVRPRNPVGGTAQKPDCPMAGDDREHQADGNARKCFEEDRLLERRIPQIEQQEKKGKRDQKDSRNDPGADQPHPYIPSGIPLRIAVLEHDSRMLGARHIRQ